IDHADPLVHAPPSADVARLQGWARKGLVEISDDGARLEKREIAVPQDRHAIEGIERQMTWFSHLRLQVMELVGHLFVGEDHAHDVDESAARKAVNDGIGHGVTLLDGASGKA